MPPGALIYTGHRPPTNAIVSVIWYTAQEHELRTQYQPDWHRNRKEGIVWTDIRNVSDVGFVETVGKDYGIHILALEDVLDTQQRAKFEEYDKGIFIVLHNLRFHADTTDLSSEQIALYAGSNFVVSFQDDPDDTFHSVRQRTIEKAGVLHRKGADYLLYILCDTIVDNYYLLLDEIDQQVQDIEQQISETEANFVQKQRIFHMKRVISQVRQRLLPLRDATMRFYRVENPVIEEVNRPYFRDLADHVAQILDHLETLRDMVSNVEALYHAETANRMNNVMRLLTVISTIFIPLSFVAGVYGMNFDYMPELKWRYGYFVVLGVMFLAMVGMLWYFKRKRWI